MDGTMPHCVATGGRLSGPRTFTFTSNAVIHPRGWANIGANSASLAVELRPALIRAPKELTS
jgi:hypothetical protein